MGKSDLLHSPAAGDLVEERLPGGECLSQRHPSPCPLLTPRRTGLPAGGTAANRQGIPPARARVGVHVGGRQGIQMALDCKVDVPSSQRRHPPKCGRQLSREYGGGFTPWGTHLSPESQREILSLLEAGVEVAIATDAYHHPLPSGWSAPRKLYGTGALMLLAQRPWSSCGKGWAKETIACATAAPAKVMGCETGLRAAPAGDGGHLPGSEVRFWKSASRRISGKLIPLGKSCHPAPLGGKVPSHLLPCHSHFDISG